jgi:hypothetical protein
MKGNGMLRVAEIGNDNKYRPNCNRFLVYSCPNNCYYTIVINIPFIITGDGGYFVYYIATKLKLGLRLFRVLFCACSNRLIDRYNTIEKKIAQTTDLHIINKIRLSSGARYL